jgi:hypothetical protein
VSRCRSLVTTLIDVLDAIEPDSDLEPSFGGTSVMYREAEADECEPPEDEELSGEENEPSLASPENRPAPGPDLERRYTDRSRGLSQARWAQGGMDEREDDDEREPNQDTGIGDLDGLIEQTARAIE